MKKFILIVVVLLTLLPLLKSGLFDVHDPTSIIRFATLSNTLYAGQFPAAWTNQLNQGYGYPLFLFYAPVFSYLGAFIKVFAPSYLIALKLAIALLVALSAIGMYRLMRQFMSSAGALVSSMAYTLLPYHASTLYVRGSYAEGVTWALLPWLLYLWSKPTRDTKWVTYTSLITSLFLLSHNSLPFAFFPFLIIWIFIFKPKTLGNSLIALALSFGATSWFLLPVIFERGLVQAESIARLTIYSDHFLTLKQLWHSPWGYGGSAKVGEVDGMSFMLGKFQLMLAGLSLIGFALHKKWDKIVIYFLSMLLFYALMATSLTDFIWALIAPLQILQFPWRLLAFASFALAALSGYLVDFSPKIFRSLFALVLIIPLVFFNLKFFRPERIVDYNDSSFLSQEKLDTVARDKIPEYLPIWMEKFPTSKSDDGFLHSAISVSGTHHLTYESQIGISTAYMPQWRLVVDNKIEPIEPLYGKIISKNYFAPGSHTFELTWHRTNIENIGLAISALSLALMIGLLFI